MSETHTDSTPEQEGYILILTIKEGKLGCVADLLGWLKEEWFPSHGYDPKKVIVRHASNCMEIMAKRQDNHDAGV